MSTKIISLPDKRKLSYCTLGEGHPVIYFHGTASSRLEVLLLKELSNKTNLQIIGIDRPGYGLSTYKPRKNLQYFNDDINFLIHHLGIKQFSILSWSGGGPFALAYLSFHPENIKKTVLVSSPALPFDVSTAHNVPFARYVMKMPFFGWIAINQLRCSVLKANSNIQAFLNSRQGKQMLRAYSQEDLKFFADKNWLNLMYNSMAEAFYQGKPGVKAVLAEHQLFMKPWGLPLNQVPAGKLVVWHGSEDLTCPVNNAYLISDVVCSDLEVFHGKGHCVMFDNIEKLTYALTSD